MGIPDIYIEPGNLREERREWNSSCGWENRPQVLRFTKRASQTFLRATHFVRFEFVVGMCEGCQRFRDMGIPMVTSRGFARGFKSVNQLEFVYTRTFSNSKFDLRKGLFMISKFQVFCIPLLNICVSHPTADVTLCICMCRGYLVTNNMVRVIYNRKMFCMAPYSIFKFL